MTRAKWALFGSVGVSLILLATATTTGAAPVLWSSNGHFYEVVIDESSTWQDARDAAAAAMYNGYRGHLATINSYNEDIFVSEVIRAEVGKIVTHVVPPTVFLGGFQAEGALEPAGGWQWVTGEPFNYVDWLSGEPNNWSGNENVVVTWSLDAAGRLQWNDGNDWQPESGYVVEYEPEEQQCSWGLGETRVTREGAFAEWPAISGTRIVWADNRSGDLDIYFRDLSAQINSGEEFILWGTPLVQNSPAISGDNVIWVANDHPVGTSDLWLAQFVDLHSYSIQEFESPGGQWNPAISGENLVWCDSRNHSTDGNWDIYLRDLNNNTEFRITPEAHKQDNPDISGNKVVWQDNRNADGSDPHGGWDIYLYDLATEIETRITSDPASQMYPAISGDRIVWMDMRNGNWDIYQYDIATGIETRITSNFDYQMYPAISGDKIVWMDMRNLNWDIYHYDLSAGVETRITSDPFDQKFPSISGDNIAWVDLRNWDQDISQDIYAYGYFYLCNTPPAANAGPDRSVHTGATATLDGGGSTDPDGDYPLTYAWRLVSKPRLSAASLANPTSVRPSFQADQTGDYVIELVVTDARGLSSVADYVNVGTYNREPIANAGPDQAGVFIKSLVTLDGSRSADPDGDGLGYRWSFVTIPTGSKSILAGSTSTAFPTFTPDLPGDYVVRLIVYDGFVDSYPDTVTITAVPLPDLVVYAFTAPTTAVPGSTISVSDTTKNNGQHDAPPSTTKFYWSTNSTVDSADIELGSRPVPALAPQATSEGSTIVVIPGGACSSAFYIIAKADGSNLVPETSETNNTKYRYVKNGPDLVISVLTGPASAGVGQTFTINETTQNNGKCPAVASITRLYLSDNTTLDAQDRELYGWDAGALAVGASSAGTATLTIPDGTAPGTRYFIAKADSGGAVAETSETNNTKYWAVKVGPDLVISSMKSPTVGGAGRDNALEVTTKNSGIGVARESVTRIYLSSNSTWDALDREIGRKEVPALGTGAGDVGMVDFQIPSGTATGLYYIIAKADGFEAVAEASESNNTLARGIAIGPDLVVYWITAPSSATRGTIVTITETTRNSGGSGTGALSITSLFLSTNTTYEAGVDVHLRSRDVVPLEGLTSSAGLSTAWTVPWGLTPGTYYLIGVADIANAVVEAKETNNTKYKAITIN